MVIQLHGHSPGHRSSTQQKQTGKTTKEHFEALQITIVLYCKAAFWFSLPGRHNWNKSNFFFSSFVYLRIWFFNNLMDSTVSCEHSILCLFPWFCDFRCFLGISPTTGTKTAKQISHRTGKVHEKNNKSVNPHVFSLLRKLIDFEWL